MSQKTVKNKVKYSGKLKRAGLVLAFAALLCICMCILLTLYLKFVPSTISALEEEGKMDNTIWLVRYGSLLPPVIILAILLTLLYKAVNDDIVNKHTDKAIVMLLVAAFTYIVLFGVVRAKSQGWQLPPPDGEEDIKSVLELSVGWFAAQILPFVMAFFYHIIRASNIKRAPLTEELTNEKIE